MNNIKEEEGVIFCPVCGSYNFEFYENPRGGFSAVCSSSICDYACAATTALSLSSKIENDRKRFN